MIQRHGSGGGGGGQGLKISSGGGTMDPVSSSNNCGRRRHVASFCNNSIAGTTEMNKHAAPAASNREQRRRRKVRRVSGALKRECTLIRLVAVVSIVLGCAVTILLHCPENRQPSRRQNMHENPISTRRTLHAKELHERRRKMKPSPVYTIPDSLPFVGDKSDRYAKLRLEYDQIVLPTIQQQQQQQQQQQHTFEKMPIVQEEYEEDDETKNNPIPYDIHNCPNEPPKNYPYAWKLVNIINRWNPDDTAIPRDKELFQGLCVFDYVTEHEKALAYRSKEVPFVVRNDPRVRATVKRWNAPGYMDRLLDDGVKHRTEYSKTNHFMYWQPPDGRRKEQIDTDNNWQPPTEMTRMTYREWLSHAKNSSAESNNGPRDDHWYFKLIACGETGSGGECDSGSSEYLFDELPFFQPRDDNPGLYLVDPNAQTGIHCTFGMTGVIAENHFDPSRNAIAVLAGERRYVLSRPDQCPLLSLFPKGHPSARHSAVDWTDPDLETHPEFALAEGNEIVLHAGDVLYLPTYWFHFIVSLNLNFQCNTRSGVTNGYKQTMRECGF